MFEATVVSGGLAQLGWAALSCRFSAGMGVGDVAHSYAYDGDRVKKWHLEAADYGLAWRRGDVVGCMLDCEARTVSFSLNGVDMGVAFEQVELGPGVAYFPACTLSTNESMRFNFGETPFAFPVSSYAPVFAASSLYARQAEAASSLLALLEQQVASAHDGTLALDEWAVRCSAVWRFLGPFLADSNYLVALLLVPAVRRMAESPGMLSLFVDSMTLFCGDATWTAMLERLMVQFSTNVFSNLHNAADLDVVTALLACSSQAFQAFFSLPRCHFLLDDLLSLKEPDARALFPRPTPLMFAKRADEGPHPKLDAEFRAQIEAAHRRVVVFEERVFRLVDMMMERDTARTTEYFSMLVSRNMDIETNPLRSTDETAMTNAFFLLLKMLDKRGVLDSSHLPIQCILQTPVEMRDMIRMGGLLSHLQKESPLDETVLPRASPVDHQNAALLDAMLMLFHLVMDRLYRAVDGSFRKLKDVQKMRGNVDPLHAAVGLANTTWLVLRIFTPQKQLLLCRALGYVVRVMQRVSTEVPLAFGYFPQYYLEFVLDLFLPLFFSRFPRFDFSQSGAPRRVLDEFVTFLVAHVNDARVANPEIRDMLMQQLNHYLSTSRFATAAAQNALARERLLPVLMANANRNWVAVSSVFLRCWKGRGFGKSRNTLINPEHFSSASSSSLLSSDMPQDVFFCFETDKRKTSPPDNSARRNSALASPTFQAIMERLCATDVELISSYLNQLFNTLNWCLSEFSVGMSEYQTAVGRKKDTVQVQKKVIVMFELSANLVRLLEIVCMCGGELLFLAPAAKVNLQRTAETILSVFERAILFPEKKIFQSILQRQNLLNDINDNVLCHPALGVLLCLAQQEKDGQRHCGHCPLRAGRAG